MKELKRFDPNAWVSLSRASKEMGVSPGTLRAWADEGRVQSYRTPGGHRRFRMSQGEAPLGGARKRAETRWRLLEHSALGRVRLALEQGGEDTNALRSYSAQSRAEHREAGRELILLLVSALQRPQADYAERAEELGRTYGELARRYGVLPRQAMTLLGFFRAAFVESVIEFAFGMGEPTPEQLALQVSRVNGILDRVSISMLEYCFGETRAAAAQK